MLLFLLTLVDSPEEQEKIIQLYEKYHQLLMSIALHILHNGADAEDAVQEVYVRLIPNLRKIQDVTCRKTLNYLVIMVRNVCFSTLRERKKIVQIPYEDLSEDALGAVEEDVLADIQFEELLQGARSLAVNDSDVLYLLLCEELSPKEIADTLDISAKAAQKRIERAKQRMKAAILKENAYAI